jgi:tRNA (cytidine/uridine-2'-O-)-methyltransferase
MFNFVLVEPQIPPNTGTIGRLCVNLGATLHLVKPLGFDIDDKAVSRAGLDYWKDLDLYEYENIEEFWSKNPLNKRHFFATTKTEQVYFDAKFEVDDFIYFGREDAGLPEDLLAKNEEGCITIPMTNDARSLNIANSVSIIAYEALRQNFNSFK